MIGARPRGKTLAMSAASAAARAAPADRPWVDPAAGPVPTGWSAGRLEAARQRERQAARRLADAIARSERAHVQAARRLEALDVLLDATKAGLRRRGFT